MNKKSPFLFLALSATLALQSVPVRADAVSPEKTSVSTSDSDVLLIHSEGAFGGFVASQEFDREFADLGLPARKIAAARLDAAALRGSELVIVGSMLLRNPRNLPFWERPDDLDLKKCGPEFHDYLEAGGTLLLTDVVEDGGIYNLAHLAQGLRLKVNKCENGLLGSYGDGTLVSSPHRLASYQPNYDPFQICRRVGGRFDWGHLSRVGRKWKILATCPDGAPVLVERRIGKGVLLVTTLSAGRAIDAGLLENVLQSARTRSGKTNAMHAPKLQTSYFRPKGAAPRGKLPFDSQGNILSGGKPFFPLGFYAVKKENYHILAQNGFNSVYDMEPGESESGLKGFATTSWDLKMAREYSEGHKSDPALLGQQLFEEPGNLPVPPFYSNYIREADDIVKAVAPNRPTFVLVNNPLEFPAFGTIGDMAACDPYPFKTATTSAVRVGDDIDYLRRLAGRPNLSVMAILQAHWFGQKGGETYLAKPTPQQLLAQTYVALVHRANGIYYFAFDKLGPNETISYIHQPDGTFDEPLWTMLKQISKEVEVLRPALFAPLPAQRARVISADNEVQSLLRRDGAKHYLLVVNPFAHPTEARLDFDREIRPEIIRARFANEEIVVGGRTVKIRLAPYAREIYEFVK